MGVDPQGPTDLSALDLINPAREGTVIANGRGTPAESVDTGDALDSVLERAMNERGPRLIEGML